MKNRITLASVQVFITIFRDVTFMLSGLAGIAYQQLTGQVSGELLVVYVSLLGIPGVVGLVQLGRGKQETQHTAGSSSQSPSSSSSPSS